MTPASHAERGSATGGAKIAILIALAIVAYLPVMRLPFIQDDYQLIPMARDYAARSWTPLWRDIDFRTRAVWVFVNYALDRASGYSPAAFYAGNILLHVLCVLLIYAAGVWAELGFSASFWAACFFAVYEGHQEAVMWVSGSSELLVVLFSLAAWVCWIKWLQEGGSRWYAGALAAFIVALGSKESAWAVPLLMLIPVLADSKYARRAAAGILPFFALAAAYAGWIWISRVSRPGYSDIRFSLSSLWPVVVARTYWRTLFIWGLAAAAILLWIGGASGRRKMWIASLWMVLAILPYSFLSYMNQLPSRATYFASAGLAILVGAAAARLAEDRRRALLAAFAAIVLATNIEILWVKKMAQFRERAEPSELLKQAAARTRGPVTIECTPLLPIVAQLVVEQAGKTAVLSPHVRAGDHCFVIEFPGADGTEVRIDRWVGARNHGVFY